MTKDDALKIALEALKSVADHRPNGETNAAIAAIKEALAQPQTHIGQYARAIEAKLKERNT